MTGLHAKKERIILAAALTIFLMIGFLSLYTILRMQGTVRVVNYVGIVRGATQKLVKEELYGIPNDPLIARLDSIVAELVTGEGPNRLVVLPSGEYLHHLQNIQVLWQDVKNEILLVRAGGDSLRLYEISEEYFLLTDRAVALAERYSERQITHSIVLLASANGLFAAAVIAALALYRRGLVFKRHADTLSNIAYLDSLTQVANRAGCELQIQRYTDTPPESDIAVVLLDMNDLKQVNAAHGHRKGDRLLADFARILSEEAKNAGFIGRLGDDEFLAVFPLATKETVRNFLSAVNERVVAYNLQYVDPLRRIGFAAGYSVGSLLDLSLPDRIHEADLRMYARKRQMKRRADNASGDMP